MPEWEDVLNFLIPKYDPFKPEGSSQQPQPNKTRQQLIDEALARANGQAGGSTAGATPLTRTVDGVLLQFDPATNKWNPVYGDGATPSGGGASSPVIRTVDGAIWERNPQTGEWSMAVPSGGGGTGGATDPLAQVRLQQAQTELQLKQQNLDFLRQKFDFEMAQGMRTEARQTQNQMFQQQMDVTRLNFDIQQANAAQERAFRTDMANLATQIGTLAQDPGDRGKYASTVLANSGWGADNSQTDMRTSDSLMPLESLLRIRQNAMGGPKPIGVNMPMPFDPNSLLGGQPAPAQIAAPNPYAAINAIAAQQNATGTNTAGFNVGANATPGGFPLDTRPDLAQPPIQGMEHGGEIEDDAYISGEAGPELNIPLGKGKAIVLNEDQLDSLGINLSRVMKMAQGGIFDGLADDDRSLATGFLDEAARRQRTNTPWEGGGQLPSPVFGSSPGFDPLVLELLASMNALERGYPAAAYKRQAALLRPQGVSERVTRRTA